MKKVTVTAEFVNLVPAHARYITRSGEGTTPQIAIKRAIDEIFDDPRLKRKRVTYPITIIVQDYKTFSE